METPTHCYCRRELGYAAEEVGETSPELWDTFARRLGFDSWANLLDVDDRLAYTAVMCRNIWKWNSCRW
jgi:hypothetical protein